MPSIGDTCRMGYHHTSETQSGESAVCCVDDGFAEAGRQRTVKRVEHSGVGGASNGKSSLGVKAALVALRFYKAYLSLLFAGNCRFQPTCSQYSYEAIERFGLARGSWLTLRRLGRCQPFSGKFGLDPVPEELSDAGLTTSGIAREVESNHPAVGATHREVHS
jgi:uncharacterized protein